MIESLIQLDQQVRIAALEMLIQVRESYERDDVTDYAPLAWIPIDPAITADC
jgi:hypothetical protein